MQTPRKRRRAEAHQLHIEQQLRVLPLSPRSPSKHSYVASFTQQLTDQTSLYTLQEYKAFLPKRKRRRSQRAAFHTVNRE